MGTYTGTAANEEINPYTVSSSVTRLPAGSKPSVAADTINGLGGADRLDGGGGGDTINGGDGDDDISDSSQVGDDGYATSTNTGNVIHGNAGNDRIWIRGDDTGGANPFGNAAYGDDGNDDIEFGFWTDFDAVTDSGQPPNGVITGYGGDGDDHLEVYSVNLSPNDLSVSLDGGLGADDLWATRWWTVEDDGGTYLGTVGGAVDRLLGGPGDDHYSVWQQEDAVVEKAGEGYDTISAFNTDFTLPADIEALEMWPYFRPGSSYRGTGNDLDNRITVEENSYWRVNYTLDGLGGNDVICGAEAADTIKGGIGNDTLYGDHGSDTISGQDGNDQIYGGRSDDDPADGPDTIYADAGNDNVWAGGGDDLVYGGSGDDNLYGQSGNDTIRGGVGNDRVYGGTGIDTLYGEDGIDNVRGGGGADRCDGGGGNDRYDFDYVSDSAPGTANRDVIMAFAGVGAAAGDRIDLATIDANAGVGGNQAFVFKGTAAITGAGQVNVIASGGDTLIRANTGGSLTPELEILVQDGEATPAQWVAGDFIL